ncbi:MAG: hypothetical protein KDE20_29380, partial [Caldilineaceae bacterium]|nr:hypothetical protein [Caldilineaceae bacterium]
LAAQMDQPVRALCLVGAAATARAAIGAPRSTAEAEKLDQALQPVIARLEPATADALLAQGAAMALDEIVACALGERPFPDAADLDPG